MLLLLLPVLFFLQRNHRWGIIELSHIPLYVVCFMLVSPLFVVSLFFHFGDFWVSFFNSTTNIESATDPTTNIEPETDSYTVMRIFQRGLYIRCVDPCVDPIHDWKNEGF